MKSTETRTPNPTTKPLTTRHEPTDMKKYLEKITSPSMSPPGPKKRRAKKPLKVDKFLYQVYGPKNKRTNESRTEDVRRSQPEVPASSTAQEFDNIFYS